MRMEGQRSQRARIPPGSPEKADSERDRTTHMRFVSEAGRMGIWDLDLRANELSGSVLFSDKYGYGRPIPFTWGGLEQAIHPDDRERWKAAVGDALATGSEYDIEYRVQRPNAGLAWLHVRARVSRAADGTPLRMAGISMDITERREAERRLELSEESLRLATDAAEVGTWDLDLDTNILTWSDRTKGMFGISPDGPCSMADFYAGLHPEDRDQISATFASAIDPAVRAIYDVEYRTIGKEDGVIRWVAAKGKGLFDDGRCRRALGTAIDITARKMAEIRQQFLLDLGDGLRNLTGPAAVIELSTQALGRHLRANRVGYGHVQSDDQTIILETCYADGVAPITGAFALSGFGAHNIARQRQGRTVAYDDITSEPLNDLKTWAAVETRSFVTVPLLRGGRFRASLFVHYRDAHVWPPEDVRLVEEVASRTWDALQRAQAEAALRKANDVLERLVDQRTEQLKANEARLRTIFETSYQLQGLLALDGTLLEANATSLAVIGSKLEDVIARPFWQTPWFTGTPGMTETVRAAVMSAAGGKNVREEISVRLPSGIRSYDFSLRPIRDASGAVVAIVLEAIDITDRRLAEDALRQAQKMEAIGQLTGGIAHDFNNLLTGILGSLEILNVRIAAGRSDESGRFISAATTAAQRAAALSQRLLAFARRQPLDPKRVEANVLIAGMEDLLRRTLGPSIGLEMVLADDLQPTLCDANQLESAILNLVINARDAMPDGGRLTIETTNVHLDDAYARAQAGGVKPGYYVAISVTDTGTGMEPEIVARAFEPFFTTKPTGQGTGLGLSMLYGFTKQSDGHVRIYSEVGHGTSFKLYLPQFCGAADNAIEDDAVAEPAAAFAKAGETVLVVDDEPAVRLLVTETLNELGYSAIEARDGPSALRILQSSSRIDMLITDVGLPGLNGRQLADAARITRHGLPVLIMTGYAHHAAIGSGGSLKPGMEILSKPFSMSALIKKIRGIKGNK